MLSGLPATVISPGPRRFASEQRGPLDTVRTSDGSIMLPAGAPNVFLEFPDTIGNNALATTGTGRTTLQCLSARARPSLNLLGPTAAASFTFLSPPTTRACVPQLGSASNLDGIGERLMSLAGLSEFWHPRVTERIVGGKFR